MADEPTLGEVVRRITDLGADLRSLRGELVRQDVYQSNRSADDLRIKVLESELKRQQENADAERKRQQDNGDAMRRLVYGAMVTAGGSVVVQGLIAWANHKP